MFSAPNSNFMPPARAGANRKSRGGAAIARAVLESLEQRRMLSVAINGSVTLDESDGLQVGGIAVGDEDNNDSDVALGTLPASFSNRLFGGTGLALDSAFATQIGVATSASDFITVSGGGTVVSLGFTKADGTPLPVFGGADPGVASGISAVNGGAISLFADPVLGNRMVIGVDAAGDEAIALFLEPNATLTSAKVWMVQLEPLFNPDSTDFDDPISLAGLGVGAGTLTEFNFNALPSGQNLFGTVGDTTSGLVVIGKTPVLNADGTFTNASNTINTSQGGGPTTIGVNNQMFDPNDGAYFTFVKNPVADFLAGATDGLDQNEADDADNIQYTGGTVEVNSAFVKISQIQGNSTATMLVRAYDMAGSPQGQTFVTSGLGTGAVAPITAVRVFDENGDAVASPQVTFGTGANGIPVGAVQVAGLDANYRVEWDTSAKHDQVLIQGVAGKFDIGGFGVVEPTSAVAPLTGIRYEDDGPAVDGSDVVPAVLTVDESDFSTNATFDAGELTPFVADFGQDGSGTTTFTYALATAGGDSGLVDTATGLSVFLFKVGDDVVGKAGADAAAAASGPTVFVVSVDTNGIVTLDQQRAIVHPDPADHDESKTLFVTDLVVVTATTIDGDGDSTQAVQPFDANLVFEDDGPSITASAVGAPTLTVDETILLTNASGGFAAQFTPVFGADGAGATPVGYELSTPGGDSGLDDTASGDSVFLFKVGDDVVGKAGADATAAASGPVVFVVSVNASGVVTLDQQRAIVHPTSDPDESKTLSAADLVVLTATATDKDNDSASAPLNIGQLLVFKDDGPTIGPIQNSIVDLVAGATVTKTLNGAVGADPNAVPYTIDSFTASVTVNGVEVRGVLSTNKQVVTYFADTNGDTTFGNAGDTAFYRLTLNQAGAGSYTFEVLFDPPPALVEFNFNALPSGQNLFGTVGDSSTGLVVIGKVPDLNADGTFTNASNTINTSKGGGPTTIGVNNQMFDPGDGAYFTFVKNPVTDFLAGATDGLDQNEADDADNIQYTGGTLEVNTAFVDVSQIQGNSLATMDVTSFDMAGSPQGQSFTSTGLGTGAVAPITAVRVYDENGVKVEDTALGGAQHPDVVVTFGTGANGIPVGSVRVAGVNANYRIEWDTSAKHDQVLIQGVGGKFDIGGFGTIQTAPTPDQKLDFVAKVVDGDGDSNTAGFSIGIDGTGIFDDGVVSGVTVSSLSSSLFSSTPIDELAALLA